MLYLTRRNGGLSKPEFRLPPMTYTSPITPIGMLIYGWAAEVKLPWILPMVGTSIVGVGLMLMLVVDPFSYFAPQVLSSREIVLMHEYRCRSRHTLSMHLPDMLRRQWQRRRSSGHFLGPHFPSQVHLCTTNLVSVGATACSPLL